MKILVTGGCGFLGSHVCEFYRNRGDEVIAYDNLTKHELERCGYAVESARDYNLNYLVGMGVTFAKEDVRDFDRLMEYSEGVDFLIHTAAQPAMTISMEDPELDFSTNVRGTFNVLKVARTRKIPVVSCGTIHIYGNKINETLTEETTRYVRTPSAIDESHPVVEGTLTPLHASKRAAELYLEAYIHSYKLNAASFRLTGLYGPRQFGGEDHGWVANFAIRALMDRPVRIFGTGKQVRDIIHPKDVVRAFHAFYEHGEPGIYNIGGGVEYATSLLECIDLLSELLGKRPTIQFGEGRLGDLLYFVCDIRKAIRTLKWSPEIPPQEGVRELLGWLEEERDLFKKDIL
jgi:CDP-paratose 2-epimerase